METVIPVVFGLIFIFFVICVWIVENIPTKKEATLSLLVGFLFMLCLITVGVALFGTEKSFKNDLIEKGLKEYRIDAKTGKSDLVWVNEEWNKIEK
jgi:hypothetical protein